MPKVFLVHMAFSNPEEGIENTLSYFETKMVSQGFTWERWSKPTAIPGNKRASKVEPGEIYVILFLEQLVRIEEAGGLSNLIFSDGRKLTTVKELDYFEQELCEYHFFRVHPNHLINIKYLRSVVKCDAYVVLTNSDLLPAKLTDDTLISYLESHEIF